MITRVDDFPHTDHISGDELDRIIDDYGLMGCMGDDLDNVYMGGWLKRLVRRIRDRVRARRARRARKGIPQQFSISTPGGTVSAGKQGFSYLPSGGGQAFRAGMVPQQWRPTSGIMQAIQANPMLLAIPAGLMFLMMSRRGGGRRNGNRR